MVQLARIARSADVLPDKVYVIQPYKVIDCGLYQFTDAGLSTPKIQSRSSWVKCVPTSISLNTCLYHRQELSEFRSSYTQCPPWLTPLSVTHWE